MNGLRRGNIRHAYGPLNQFQVSLTVPAEAFLAAADARSFRTAAASLALSPSAFSRRIQLLERFVGGELFHRGSSQSQLSAAGHAYLAEIGPAIETIRVATMAMRAQHGERDIVSEPLATMEAVPVCAPRLADGRMPPRTLAELGQHRLLADRVSRRIWPRWRRPRATAARARA